VAAGRLSRSGGTSCLDWPESNWNDRQYKQTDCRAASPIDLTTYAFVSATRSLAFAGGASGEQDAAGKTQTEPGLTADVAGPAINKQCRGACHVCRITFASEVPQAQASLWPTFEYSSLLHMATATMAPINALHTSTSTNVFNSSISPSSSPSADSHNSTTSHSNQHR
jgi:hypothetical protein